MKNQTKILNRVSWYGWQPDRPDLRDLIHMPVLDAGAVPPNNVVIPMPPHYDQGQEGSCTGNALAGITQCLRRQEGLPDWVPSRNFIYYNERWLEGTIKSDSGAMIRDGIKSLNTWGVCDEKLWPYVQSRFTRKPTVTAYRAAAQHKAVKYARVLQTRSNFMATLAGGLPFVIGFTVYESFESDEVAKTGIVQLPQSGEQEVGGHAVCVIGYDVNSDRLLVRNSWGENWGQGGNFTIPFDYFLSKDLADDAWVIQLDQ